MSEPNAVVSALVVGVVIGFAPGWVWGMVYESYTRRLERWFERRKGRGA